ETSKERTTSTVMGHCGSPCPEHPTPGVSATIGVMARPSPGAGSAVPDARIHHILSSIFGFSSFRPLQEEIVRCIVQGQDVFALMSTGGGKSLCYQLPALLLEGTTVVVSPLIALMKDQLDMLRERGVTQVVALNSTLTEDQEREAVQRV